MKTKQYYFQIKRLSNLLFFIALPVLIASCGTSGNMVPGNPEYTESYDVLGIQDFRMGKNIEFGPFRVHNIEWNWKGKIDNGDKNAEIKKKGRNYRFHLSNETTDHWDVECQMESHRAGLDDALPVVRGDDRPYLKCNMSALDESGRVASILLQNRANRPMIGRVGYGSDMIEVTSARNGTRLLNNSRITGYNIKLEQEVVSAVQISGERKIWFNSGIDEEFKNLFSATAVALLLHEEILATD